MKNKEYIDISKAFSSSLVEKVGASTTFNSFVPINKIAELKELKSNRSLRLAIQKGKYIAREVKVFGGKSYEILYSSLEPEIQRILRGVAAKRTPIASNPVEGCEPAIKIKSEIEQYHSLGYPSKKVRCIETGQIFENAGIAAKWVAFAREESYCNLDFIKQCSRGKQKTSYGYHWEWVNEEIEKVKERLNKRIE